MVVVADRGLREGIMLRMIRAEQARLGRGRFPLAGARRPAL